MTHLESQALIPPPMDKTIQEGKMNIEKRKSILPALSPLSIPPSKQQASSPFRAEKNEKGQHQ